MRQNDELNYEITGVEKPETPVEKYDWRWIPIAVGLIVIIAAVLR